MTIIRKLCGESAKGAFVLPMSTMLHLSASSNTYANDPCPDGYVLVQDDEGNYQCIRSSVCEGFDTVETGLLIAGIAVTLIGVALLPITGGAGIIGLVAGIDLVLVAVGADIHAGSSC